MMEETIKDEKAISSEGHDDSVSMHEPIKMRYVLGKPDANISKLLEEYLACIDYLENHKNHYDEILNMSRLHCAFRRILFFIFTIVEPIALLIAVYLIYNCKSKFGDALLYSMIPILPMLLLNDIEKERDMILKKSKHYLVTHPVSAKKNQINGYMFFSHLGILELCEEFSRSIPWIYLKYCVITSDFTAFVFYNEIEPLILNTSERQIHFIKVVLSRFEKDSLLIDARSFHERNDEFKVTIYNENDEPKIIDQYDDTEE